MFSVDVDVHKCSAACRPIQTMQPNENMEKNEKKEEINTINIRTN